MAEKHRGKTTVKKVKIKIIMSQERGRKL